MQPETEPHPPSTDSLPETRPRTTRDLAVAKLRNALQERSGYVVVAAESAEAAAELFDTVEPRLSTFRTVRASGRSLDPEAVVRSLWRDGEPPFPARLAMRALIDEARAAGQPIVVAITDADATDAVRLERVRLTLEGAPDAGEIVRIALLGGPALCELLRQPETRAVSMRIGATVSVPASSAELPSAVIVPAPEAPVRRPARAAGAVVGMVVLGTLAWAAWRPPGPRPASQAAYAQAAEGPAGILLVQQVEAPLEPAPPVPPPSPADPPPVIEAPPDPEPEETQPLPLDPDPPPTREPETPAPEAARPGEGGPALQVGAFVRRESAEALREKLAPHYPSVWISPMTRGTSTFHRVRVGGFRSTKDLDVAAAALRTAGYTPLRVRE